MDIICSCGPKNISFTDGMNSKNDTKCETVKRQQTPNQQHVVYVMPKWDKKKGIKRTK